MIKVIGVIRLCLFAVILQACAWSKLEDNGQIENISSDTKTEELLLNNSKIKPNLAEEKNKISNNEVKVENAEKIFDRMPQERFDVGAVDIPAQQFYMSLVEGAQVNIIVHPDVSGNISINLKSVSLQQALRAVRDVYGFDYVKMPYGYQIIPLELQSKIFKIDYLNINRSGNSSTLVSSGQVSFANGGSTASADNQGGESESGGNTIQSSEIQTKTEADFWLNVESVLNRIVGAGGDRSVVVDPLAGIIFVRAYPAEIRNVEEFLQRAEASLLRQVIIEAKILEVSLDEGYESGIQWDTFGLGFNGELSNSNKKSFASMESAKFEDLVDNSVEGVFSVGVNVEDFTSVIRLLEAHGDVKVLSSPRIATVNNQKAVIKVGTDEFFVTNVANSTVTSASSTSATPEVTLTPFFSGIALDVTPQISHDNRVILHVHPTITSVQEKIKDIGIGADNLTLPLAFSSIRESDTIIKADNGQIVIIGGLMQDSTTLLNSGIPVLSRIPLLGKLFKQERNKKTRSELVILLRPKIIELIDGGEDYDLLRKNFPEHFRSSSVMEY